MGLLGARLGRLLPDLSRIGRRDLRTSVRYADVGPAGPLVGPFARLRHIRGSFNLDDCAHFHLVLSMQRAFGIRGDCLEIGSFHGRSTAFIARYLAPGEALHVCDAFRLLAGKHNGRGPTPATLLANVLAVNPSLESQRVRIYECLSEHLPLAPQLKFRFIHVDGGHSREQTLLDLGLSSDHLIDKGVIVVDDHQHPRCPGVARAVQTFLNANPEFSVLADLNRHGAKGRKLYLMREGTPRSGGE